MQIVVRQSKYWLLIGMIVMISGAMLFAVGGSAESRILASPEASPQASPSASPVASPMASPGASITIDIAMMAFQTTTIEIPVGTTVTWVNKDVVAHTVTHRPTSGSALFDSGYFNTGESWSYTFDTQGTFDYYCIPHPNMVAVIIVI